MILQLQNLIEFLHEIFLFQEELKATQLAKSNL
jgi:hypothetical protein